MTEVSVEEPRALVSKDLCVSRWIEINQPRIDEFTKTFEDHQLIRRHDASRFPEYVAACGYGIRPRSRSSKLRRSAIRRLRQN